MTCRMKRTVRRQSFCGQGICISQCGALTNIYTDLGRGATRDSMPADSIPTSLIPPSNNLLQRYPQGDLPSPLPALCPCPVPEGDPFWDINDPDHPSPNQLYLAYHLLQGQSTQLGGVDGRSNEDQHQQTENIAEPPYSSNSTQNPFPGDLGILYRDLSIGGETVSGKNPDPLE